MLTDDESDYGEWLVKLGESLQYPPWLIPQALTIPQYYGIWCRESALDVSRLPHAAIVDLINERRKAKGLAPMSESLPSCVRVPTE